MKNNVLSKGRYWPFDQNKMSLKIHLAAMLIVPITFHANGSTLNSKILFNKTDFTTERNHLSGNLLAPITITGTVVDETNSPMPGVNIKSKDGTVATVTDINGKFTINVEASTVLVFSFVG
jgi:hypothetical protein